MAIVTVESMEHLKQEVISGMNRIVADEPLETGGTDAGFDPYSLLLAALGACTSMTLKLYAINKGWDLQKVHITLRHEKIHAADCASCETKEGKLDRIWREIKFEGELSGEQQVRLREIAKRCPVHRTLISEISIVDL